MEAEDFHGNIARSPIQHVRIGANEGSGSDRDRGLSWSPPNPTPDDSISITITGAGIGGTLHWGINGWQQPNAVYRPPVRCCGVILFPGAQHNERSDR